jgi:osmotically-inducible protein OsmY
MESGRGTTYGHVDEGEVSHLKTQNMNRKHRILASISAVSVFSLPAIANDTSGPKPAAYHQPATFSQTTRAADGLTSFEQNAKSADLAITARIRAAVRAGKNLSMSARNVKIITIGGRVVLRGAVVTAEEKRLIGNIAIGVRRRENVDNQLNVRPAPPSAPSELRVVE